jgi:N-methylhydantoinase A/oxoprolinase/acetone carboxylase beta subunit
MKYGLGIDTGGTYTDAVIYEFENHTLLAAAKSVTVKEDLTIGINSTLELLPQDMLGKVKLVSLSTTLATNACVEGKGSRAKLILIGCDSDIVGKYGGEC